MTPSLTMKRLGEISELCFFLAVTRYGFTASKPWGDSDAYDCIVEGAAFGLGDPHKLSRVQVRSASYSCRGHYTYLLTRGTAHRPWVLYTPQDIDFFAFYIDPEQLWYIVPIEEVAGKAGISLTPRGRCRYNKFMEAWSLLGEPLRPPISRPKPRPIFLPYLSPQAFATAV